MRWSKILGRAFLAFTLIGSLSGQSMAASVESRVHDKAKEVQTRFPEWVRAGGDPSRLESLPQQVDSHIKANELTEAEAVLDQILAILNGASLPAAPASDPAAQQARLQEKAQRFQQQAPLWVSAGGDPSVIDPLGKKLDGYLKAAQLDRAETVLDELLALVGAPAASAMGAPQSAVATTGNTLGPEKQVRLARIPDSAEIVFHTKNKIYVMDVDGKNTTQITFDGKRHLEHVAVAPDRIHVAANYFAQVSQGHASSQVVLYDLEKGTERVVLPDFVTAGNGGVDWDRDGYIYFAAVGSKPYPRPKNRSEFMANAGANDVWKIRFDGTGLTRLTQTSDRGEADVSVSEDGSLVAYMDTYIDPPNDYTEIRVMNSDGSRPKMVYKGGKDRISSVHDPEISPDNTRVVFSQVNPEYKNFPNNPNANTAHDILSVRLDGSGLRRLTEPGPISVIPDWKGSKILHLLMTDRESPPFYGVVVMSDDGTHAVRIKGDANIAKWIPSRN